MRFLSSHRVAGLVACVAVAVTAALPQAVGSAADAATSTTSVHARAAAVGNTSAISAYLNSHQGQKVGAGQCVSLILNYVNQVFGVTTGSWGNADDYAPYKGAGITAAYTGAAAKALEAAGFVWTSGTGYQLGDIVVWGGNADRASDPVKYGHVAIATGPGTRFFDQNWGGRETAGYDTISATPLGYWHKGTPTPPSSNPCLTAPANWQWVEPTAAVQLAIQQEMSNDGIYHGWINGIWGTLSKAAIQQEIKNHMGYAGPVNGVPGGFTTCYVQYFARTYGGYTGPIDGIPGVNTWNGFLAALRNT